MEYIISQIIKGILDHFAVSQEDASAAAREIATSLEGQLKVDEAEAASQSVFVAGWRPAIGWVCSLAILWQFFIRPLVTGFIPAPSIDTSVLLPLVLGLLGIHSFDLYHKIRPK